MSGRAARASKARKLVPVTVLMCVHEPDATEWRQRPMAISFEDYRKMRQRFAKLSFAWVGDA